MKRIQGNIFLNDLWLQDLPDLSDVEVTDSFRCDNNHLMSLRGMPKAVSGYVDVSFNQLSSLKGCPPRPYSLFCQYNKLTSLEGSPDHIEGDLSCSNNQLRSFRGGPRTIYGYLSCSWNPLESLEGFPREIRGDLFFHGYTGKFTEDDIRSICYVRGTIFPFQVREVQFPQGSAPEL